LVGRARNQVRPHASLVEIVDADAEVRLPIAAAAQGPIKTFTLRGIKDSPPYLHDGRLLTLEDTVEFFNLVLGVNLTRDEKADLVAFLRVL
jgi:cytochrome c peroxidase